MCKTVFKYTRLHAVHSKYNIKIIHLLWITKTLYFNNLSSYLLACTHLTKSVSGHFPFKRNNLPPLIVWNSPFLQFWWYRCKNFTGIICEVQVSHFHWRDRYHCKSFLVFFDCGTTNLKIKILNYMKHTIIIIHSPQICSLHIFS
jgi:hypothetical protein